MREVFAPTVYLLASRRRGTLYVGVTSNLLARIHQHRDELLPGFTSEYGVKQLVWLEQHAARRRQSSARSKAGKRNWKFELIEAANPEWRDLAQDFGFPPSG